jgi:hypothetical protein
MITAAIDASIQTMQAAMAAQIAAAGPFALSPGLVVAPMIDMSSSIDSLPKLGQ